MLFLTEDDVKELLPMTEAIEQVEASLKALASGHAVNRSRERILLPQASLHYMAAALTEEHLVGLKIYTVSRDALRFLVLLYNGATGQLLCALEADHLGRIRTGAASGVATRHLARAEASRVGLIGAGRQARTQLEAIARVRKITAVKVFSRGTDRLRDFCRWLAERLELNIEPAETAEAAVRFGDIVITATSSPTPVIQGEWLSPGAHVNAIGANMANRSELDHATLARARLVAVDSLEQVKQEAGDLIQGISAIPLGWDGVIELSEVASGKRSGRSDQDEITIFKSTGIAIWDVAVAGYVYRQALARGQGKTLEIWGEA
jgi:ornithine cyclodeaminase/alanine dehydrogenase-like protein (mu-crystallin family)